MLVIEKITKRYKNKLVLDALSLTVAPGSIAVLLGSSGVGKSTLLRVLNGLEQPDAGTVYLHGIPLDLHAVNRSHGIGMIFQQFNLFEHLTVLENVTYALTHVMKQSAEYAKQTAHTLLAKYHLDDKAHTYPAQLSGGQKQRLAIVRTLAMRPSVICFDEPTSALDPVLTSVVAEHITELAREGFIILVASHDISLVEKLPCTLYLMHHGRIVETASSKDFVTHATQYPRITAFTKGIQEM